MKIKNAALALIIAWGLTGLDSVLAQGTAFTYQGQLVTSSGPASGTYDFTFTLYGTNSGGVAIAGPVTNSSITCTNPGLFTASVDFGNAFNGAPGWLEIGVRPSGGASQFVTLSPRQPVTPTPYALYSQNATMLANNVALGNGAGNMIPPNSGGFSFIGGGMNNQVLSLAGFVGGGMNNTIGPETTDALIGGGSLNLNNGSYGTMGGGVQNAINNNGPFSTIGGGSNNFAGGASSTIGGGDFNRATGNESTVAGGSYNTASAPDSTVGGGFTNVASGTQSFVGGGFQNTANNNDATVAGGGNNTASGEYASVGGGEFDQATSVSDTVPGGYNNIASGGDSFAAGSGARATLGNCFLWADGEAIGFNPSDSSDRANQFKVQASGGVQMDVSGSSHVNPAALFINSSSATGVGLYVVQTNSNDGCVVLNTGATMPSTNNVGDLIRGFGWTPGPFGAPNQLVFSVNVTGDVRAHSFNSTSDRNAKENFAAISPAEVLGKVVSMPISRWNFKTDPADQQHIGPMAQDFHAAFDLNGADDKRINLTDEGGVALAAIQGLNQKLDDKDTEIQSLKLQNETLEKRLAGLEQAVKSITQNQ